MVHALLGPPLIIAELSNNMSKFDIYHRDITGNLHENITIQTALEDFKNTVVTNKPILVEIQNHLGGRALAVGIQSLSNYNSFLVITLLWSSIFVTLVAKKYHESVMLPSGLRMVYDNH